MLRNLMKEKGFLGNTKSFSNLSKMNAAAPKNFNGITRALFAASEQGLSYDFNDLSTLFQDSAGTIPVTGAGQPVGLVLDKSRGLVLGPELWVSPTLGAEWIDNGGGSYTFNSPTGAYAELAIAGLSAGKFYEVRFTASVVQNQVSVRQNGVIKSAQYNSGTFRLFVTGGTNVTFSRYNGGGVASLFTVSSISVRELPGNHAFQSTAASRPILRHSPILGPELVSNGTFDTGTTGWLLGAGAGQLSHVAGRLRISATADGPTTLISTTPLTTVAGRTYTVTLGYGSKTANNAFQVNASNNSNGSSAFFTSSHGGLGSVSVSGVNVVFTATATTTYLVLRADCGAVNVAGDYAEFDNISVREITGYDSRRSYLEFDGVDDFLQTNAIDFTSTDKVSVFAGVRKLSDVATGIAVELSSDASLTNGAFALFAPASSGANSYRALSRGTVDNYAGVGVFAAAPNSSVLSVFSSISGDRLELMCNGALGELKTTDQGTGTYGNHPLYIGRRGGTSLPFNGHLYGLTIIGRLTNDLETRNIEKLLAKNTGVSLV